MVSQVLSLTLLLWMSLPPKKPTFFTSNSHHSILLTPILHSMVASYKVLKSLTNTEGVHLAIWQLFCQMLMASETQQWSHLAATCDCWYQNWSSILGSWISHFLSHLSAYIFEVSFADTQYIHLSSYSRFEIDRTYFRQNRKRKVAPLCGN